MKYFLLLFIAFIFAFPSAAQEWTTPVNVSNMEGQDQMQDFYIDNNKTIHCVWTHMYSSTFSKIYYSKSYDDGASWSVPEDISQNSTMWCLRPHIVASSQNYLFVSYDYDSYSTTQSLVVLKYFDGSAWSDADTVSTGMPGAKRNKLNIDNNDRVYCFWYVGTNTGHFSYRLLEDNTWSEIFSPYSDDYHLLIKETVIDSDNMLHCLGNMFNEWSYDETATYFYYDPIIHEWSGVDELNNKSSGMDADIDLDVQNNPHIAWRQKIYLSGPNNDSTMYRYFNGNNWTESELIVEDPSEQIIIVDENNRSNIFDTEKTEDGSMLVHYYKLNGSWQGYIVTESDWSSLNSCAMNFDNKLYLMYRKPIDQAFNSEILFTKSDIISKIGETVLKTNKIELQIYPNPFSQAATINFSIASPGKTTLKIYNLKGELLKVLLEKNLMKGNFEVKWDATSKKGIKVKTGLYLVRLQRGKYMQTHSIEYIK